MRKLLWVLPFLFLFTGCAKDYYTSYRLTPDAEAFGNVIVKFPNAVQNVNVTIDGSLVAEDKFTKKIEVDSLSVGPHEVKVIASSWELKRDINQTETIHIEENYSKTMLVQVPPKSIGFWIYQTASFTASFIAGYYIYH